ncbi:MAG TPA: PQQ-binding-like beta-propeller repeat protein [Dehalococcoidales bacterium]|nr:PQQ-binding-like beta-propeller repeat protein [Dehalococcoidales bacterium]
MSSATENKLWVICPVCHKANPAGVRFCQHCWGAAINQDTTLTTEELAEATRHREEYLKRRKKVKIASISGGILALLLSIYLSLVHFTDLIYKPSESLNSSSRLGEWAMFRHSLDGSGSTGTTDVIPQGTLNWKFQTGAPVQSSPSVADGAVFFGSQDYKFYALDAVSGTKNWEFETGSWVESSPSVSRGVVYFGSNDGKLYALDIQNGRKNWEFPTTFPVRSAPAIAGDVVYFGSEDYNLYALDIVKGTRIWKYDIGSPAVSPPVIANGILYIGASDGYSYAFNALNGQRRLRFSSHYAVYASPIVVDKTVYLVTTNGYLYSFDGMARTWLWEHELKPFWLQLYAMGVPGIPRPSSQSGFLWSTNLRGAVNASPVISGDTIYVSLDKRIVAFNTRSLKKTWTFATDGTIRSSPIIANNILYFGSDDGKLYAVDAATGKKLWDFKTGGPVYSTPSIANGMIYVGSDDGNLYAIK